MIKSIFNNNKGIQMIELLVIIGFVAAMATICVPKINTTLNHRTDNSVKVLDNTDTSIIEKVNKE